VQLGVEPDSHPVRDVLQVAEQMQARQAVPFGEISLDSVALLRALIVSASALGIVTTRQWCFLGGSPLAYAAYLPAKRSSDDERCLLALELVHGSDTCPGKTLRQLEKLERYRAPQRGKKVGIRG
jgi:hypothetical protein